MKTTASVPITLTEISLLSSNECLFLEERTKRRFDYPLHKHEVLELNLIENCKGVRRIIGDSLEPVNGSDLVLVGPMLEHEWAEGDDFEPRQVHEVTIHFDAGLVNHLPDNQFFNSLHRLMDDARQGICFSQEQVQSIRPQLQKLSLLTPGFHRYMLLIDILHSLADDKNYRLLSTAGFSSVESRDESERIRKATDYINHHFQEVIRLDDLADMAGMSASSFSHFFRMRTHKTVMDYIIEQRLGYAIRQLVESKKTILEICYESGFNNVSHFNRQFLKRKGYTPSEYREHYQSSKQVLQSMQNGAKVDEKRHEIKPQ